MKEMYEKSDKIKAQMELSRCTFKPKLNIPRKKNDLYEMKNIKDQVYSLHKKYELE